SLAADQVPGRTPEGSPDGALRGEPERRRHGGPGGLLRGPASPAASRDHRPGEGRRRPGADRPLPLRLLPPARSDRPAAGAAPCWPGLHLPPEASPGLQGADGGRPRRHDDEASPAAERGGHRESRALHRRPYTRAVAGVGGAAVRARAFARAILSWGRFRRGPSRPPPTELIPGRRRPDRG